MKSTQELQKIWNAIEKTDSIEEQRNLLISYCKKNIELTNTESLSIPEAGYNMCGACAHFFHLVQKNPLLDSVMDLTCDIELYPDHISKETCDIKWKALLELLKLTD